ncbi:hypothetical protein ACEXQD_09115 [Herbiconiux sp. P15]|uniref:hypothetical protein n=1 Tax=Herbiconiux liukaitaii TaxID=3342799 RepID=UPI0035B882E6
MAGIFDPALADEAMVEQIDGRWFLTVRRFTGDVLARSPLHVSGDFPTAVLKLATRLLQRWHIEYSSTADWVEYHGSWSTPVHPYNPRANTVRL